MDLLRESGFDCLACSWRPLQEPVCQPWALGLTLDPCGLLLPAAFQLFDLESPCYCGT